MFGVGEVVINNIVYVVKTNKIYHKKNLIYFNNDYE